VTIAKRPLPRRDGGKQPYFPEKRKLNIFAAGLDSRISVESPREIRIEARDICHFRSADKRDSRRDRSTDLPDGRAGR
jgi:hypothetical protein